LHFVYAILLTWLYYNFCFKQHQILGILQGNKKGMSGLFDSSCFVAYSKFSPSCWAQNSLSLLNKNWKIIWSL